MDSREQIARIIFAEVHPDYPWGMTNTMDDASWRRREASCLSKADKILALIPQSKPQMRVSALIAEVLDQAKHEENPAGLKWIASRLASLDLLPDPPKEAELTPEEITTAIDYAYSEENMIHHRASDYDEMKLSAEQCVAQAAAKKARAFTLDEVLKDPEKFGLQPIPKVVQ